MLLPLTILFFQILAESQNNVINHTFLLKNGISSFNIPFDAHDFENVTLKVSMQFHLTTNP